MKHYFIILILASCNLTGFAQFQTVIKYSTQDCMFCNAQLYNIPDEAAKDVHVWMKASSETESELGEVINTMKQKRMSLLFSDSAYYSIDSSERSKVYLFKDNLLQSADYLKDIKAEAINKYFNSNIPEGQIFAKKILRVVSNEEKLYLLEDYRRILTVKKSNLNAISDSLKIYDSEIRQLYINALTKARGSNDFIKYQKILYNTHLSNKVWINDFCVVKDTFFLAMSTLFADSSVSRSGYFASNKPFIAAYIKGKLIKLYVIDGTNKDNTSHINWAVDASNMVYRNGKFLLSINMDTLTEYAPMLAIMKPKTEKLELVHLANYTLPKDLVSTNIGYMMSGVISSRRYISNTYSAEIYDVDNNASMKLDFPHDSNSFTRAQVSTLHFKISFQVLALYDDNDKLILLTKNKNTVECIKYKRANNALSFLSRKLVSDIDHRYAYSNWIACDKDGLFVFSKDEHYIKYIPYP